MWSIAQQLTLVLQTICTHKDMAIWGSHMGLGEEGCSSDSDTELALERLGEGCTVGVLDGLGQDICAGSLCSYLLHHKADLLLSPTEFHTDADEQMQCKMAARGKEPQLL